MKRIFVILLALCVLLASCGGEREFYPAIVVPEGFTVSENTICANLVNVYFFAPYDEIYCENGTMTLYDDAAHTNYFDGGYMELVEGENKFYAVFEGDGGAAEYILVLNCTMILDFSVEVINEKTYSVSDEFDRSTVRVIAERDAGGTVEVSDYNVECDLSVPGERRVGIFYGGIVRFIYVKVE